MTEPDSRPTAVLAANSSWNIANFRAPLISALRARGWRVVVVAPEDSSAAAVRAMGAELVPIAIDSGGTSIVRDAQLLAHYWRTLRAIGPQLFLGFTVKPNIYGSLAAGLLRIRVINNISGLGTAFMQPGLLNRLVSQLYRRALRRSERVFFQNRHDRDLFVGRGLVRSGQAQVIPGSGVDLDRFRPAPSRGSGRPLRFLFVGRLLRDKGLVEFAEAARLVRRSRPDIEFQVLGFGGSNNPSAVPEALVECWRDEGLLTYLGETDDVRPFLEDCDCVVLPSYREGLPRALLEGAAMARPMIATDVPGCSAVVVDGENGFLCSARSPSSLAEAMERMLRLTLPERQAMGRKARDLVERQFDQRLVVEAYLEAIG